VSARQDKHVIVATCATFATAYNFYVYHIVSPIPLLCLDVVNRGVNKPRGEREKVERQSRNGGMMRERQDSFILFLEIPNEVRT
jgi:hypothetical protein